jgi:DNA-binding GntR family transcriptional regulator
MLVEIPTVAYVASRLTPARFEELAVAAEAIERAAADGDILEYLDADRRFHVELISAIGNARLTDLVDRLRRQARLFGLKDLAKSGRLLASAREHRTLLGMLSAQDIQAAENLLRTHIGHTRGLWAGRQDRD